MHQAPDIPQADAMAMAALQPAPTGAKPAFQRSADRVVGFLFLWAFPRWIRPNHLTIARLLLIPVVLVLLRFDHRWWGLATYLVAMSTDFIDGAMARARDQITIFGTYADPAADKLLVAAVLAWVGYHYLVVQIMLGFIVLELILSAVGARILLKTRTMRPSNLFGKAKMILQSVVLVVFLVAGILDLKTPLTVSIYLLWAALALAVVSGGLQICGLAKSKPEAS